MKLFFFSMALCAVLMINETARSQCSRDLIGTWHAQNATLTITAIAAGGRVTGSYTLPSGAPRVLFPVMGWVNPVAPASKKFMWYR